MGRFAFFGSAGLTVLAVFWVVILRVEDGAAAPTAAVPVRIARMAFWLTALPVVLAAASSRMLADRKDGIEALARTQGFASGAVVRARIAAAAVLVYAAVSGSAAGALGAIADVLSPRRGRSLLLTVTFVSWALADVASEPRLSVTGLLALVLKQLLSWFGLGRLGS